MEFEGWISCVTWSPDGSKIGLSIYKRIIIYDARSYEQLHGFTVDGCYTLDFSPKGDHLVYDSGTSVLVWNLNLDVDISRFLGHSYLIRSVAFSSGGNTIVSCAGDRLVKIWRFRSEERGSDHEPERPEYPYMVSFTPVGQLMATATSGEREVKLWDAMTCSHIVSLYLEPDQVELLPQLAFSPDSSLIACKFFEQESMRIWDVNVNTRAIISYLHGAAFFNFCFSPVGDRIAMFDFRSVPLWDVHQGNLIAELTWPELFDEQSEIAFFEDGFGIQITPSDDESDPIILDIILSSHQSDDHDQDDYNDDSEEDSDEEVSAPTSNRSLPFEFVVSSKENPVLFLKYREYASYNVAHGMDWFLDTQNRSVFSIPPDQIPRLSRSWDAHGTRIAWCGSKGFVLLDFAHVSTDTGNDIDNTDRLFVLE